MAAVNARTPAVPPRRGERGSVLLLVAVFGLLAMGLWGLAWRSTHDAIRVERFTVQRNARARSVLPALAHGVALLRTGHPPEDPYVCLDTVVDGAVSYPCVVSFESQADTEHWLVEARAATSEEEDDLPAMPADFSD
jgi:hypothetical protein